MSLIVAPRPSRLTALGVGALLVLTTGQVAAQPSTITNIYDDLNRLIGVVDQSGEAAIYAYDATGNVLSVTRQPAGVVSLLTFTPKSGPVGTAVTLSGTGFGAAPGENTVTFNGTTATVTAGGASQLVVPVPPGATTGPITVATPTGSATSAEPFMVLTAPTIAGFTPAAGGIGATVTVAGSGFSPAITQNAVRFNGALATVTAASPTQLVTAVPVGGTTGPVSVTTLAGTTTSRAVFTVLSRPQITSLSPSRGAPGIAVTITGAGFGTTPSENTVTFSGVPAVVAAATATTLTTSVPVGATTGVVRVTAAGGSASSVFTVPAPRITGFFPSSGASGARVTITGQDFSPIPPANTVAFNGIAATVLSAAGSELTVTVPGGATTGPITVGTSGGTATSATPFIVSPRITGFTPASGAAGTPVTLSGANFREAPSENQVAFDGVAAFVRAATATRLDVVVPAGATTGPITVTTLAGTATSPATFTIVGEAALTSVDPSILPRGRAIRVTFTASTDLTGAQLSTLHPHVTIGDVQASGTTLTAVITPDARAPLQPFEVQLRLETAVLRAVLRLSGVDIGPAAGLAGQGPIAARIAGVGVDLTGATVVAETPLVAASDVRSGASAIDLTLAIDPTTPSGAVRLFVDTAGGVRHQARFTVVNVPPEPRLAVLSLFPPPGTPSAPGDEGIRIRVTDPLDALSVTPDAVRVTEGSTPVGGTLALSADGTTLTFAPDRPLAAGTRVTVTLARALRSQAGEALPRDEVHTFTTATQVLLVDAARGDDTTGDGTAAAPFATIGRALGAASPGTLVRVGAGTYAETLAVPSGATVEGAGVGLTVVDGTAAPAPGPVITVQANTAILRLGVRNGAVGIFGQVPPLIVGEVAATGQTAAGIRLQLPFLATVTGDVVIMSSTLEPAPDARGVDVTDDADGRLQGSVALGGNTVTTRGGEARGISMEVTIAGAVRVIGNVVAVAAASAQDARSREALFVCCDLQGPVTVLANRLIRAGPSALCCSFNGRVTISHNAGTEGHGYAVFDVCCTAGPQVGEIRILDNAVTDGFTHAISVCCGGIGAAVTVARNRLERNPGVGVRVDSSRGAVTVVGNSVTASGELQVSSTGDGDLTIVGNTVTSSGYYGLRLGGDDKPAAAQTLVVGNRIEGSGGGVAGLDLCCALGGTVEITDNSLITGQGDGLGLTVAQQAGTLLVARNVIEGLSGIGFWADLVTPYGATATIRDNRIAGNGDDGVQMVVSATTAVPAVVRRNTITGHGGHGLRLFADFSGSGANPDLGTGTDPGENALTGNGTAAPGTFFNLTNETASPISAVGNRWDHATAAEIDRLDIFDDEEGAPQGRTLGRVEFEPFLPP